MISCPNCGQSNCAFDQSGSGGSEWWECFDCRYVFCLASGASLRATDDDPVAWS